MARTPEEIEGDEEVITVLLTMLGQAYTPGYHTDLPRQAAFHALRDVGLPRNGSDAFAIAGAFNQHLVRLGHELTPMQETFEH